MKIAFYLKNSLCGVLPKTLFALLLVSLFTSCTRKTVEKTSFKIKLPDTGKSFSSAKVSALVATSWGLTDPSAFSDINCYAVFVSAADLNQTQCVDSSSNLVFSAGLVAGLYPAGQEVSVEVPSGSARTIRLVGLKSSGSSVCLLPAGGTLPPNDLSAPFILGAVTTDLAPGTQVISIPASLVAGNKFHSCSGDGFAFGPDPATVTPPPVLVATLASLPASYSNVTSLSANVSGSGVVDYKYKVGTDVSTDCTLTTGYSAAFSTSSPISDSIVGLADGSIELCVLGGDGAGNFQSLTSPTSYIWTKDTVAPTTAFTSPAPSSYINSVNASSFSVSGTCSDTGQSVNFSGGATGTTTCASGTWTHVFDLSASGDGSITISVDHGDLAGNSASGSRSFTKDTVAPGSPSISIDTGNTNTSSQSVSLTLSASTASEMYVTNTADCLSGGTWETTSSPKSWNLASIDSLQSVFVKFRDAAGNESNCVSDTITHSSPALITISDGATYDFGAVATGGFASKAFTLSNSGYTSATGISEIGLGVPFAFVGGSFPGSGGNCTTTLAPATTCTIAIKFYPTGTGAFTDTIDISYNDGVGVASSTRPIAGTGVAPAVLSISDGPTYDFGTVITGGVYEKTFTVSNSGGANAIAITGSGLAAPFEFKSGSFPGTGGTCTSSLAPAATCTVVVQYTPSTSSVHSDSMDINYNDGAMAQTSSRAMQGTGVSAAFLAISGSNPYDFGSVGVFGNLDYSFTITNTGGSVATALAESGLAAPFSMKGSSYPGTGGDCGATLAPLAVCTIVISYSPTVSGPHSDTLFISYNDGLTTQPTSLDLSGSGASSNFFNYLALGLEQSCGKKTSGDGFCWGNGAGGALGNNSTTNSLAAVPISGSYVWSQMDSFTRTTCGITSSSQTYCWGDNLYGQIGDGSVVSRSVPTLVSGGHTFTKIAVGNGHSCGLNTSGAVLCWGQNNSGQLGNGTTTNSSTPVTVSGGNVFVTLDANGSTTCGINNSGAVLCWGNGSIGQMANNTSTPINSTPQTASLLTGSFLTVAVGFGHVCALKNDNTVNCWGSGVMGQIGDGSSTDRISTIGLVGGTGWNKIVAGDSFTCGYNSGSSEVFCWGQNSYGQIGDGTTSPRNIPTLVGANYVDVFTGSNHACGIKNDNSLWCWGQNNFGQLGDGTTTTRLSPFNVNP